MVVVNPKSSSASAVVGSGTTIIRLSLALFIVSVSVYWSDWTVLITFCEVDGPNRYVLAVKFKVYITALLVWKSPEYVSS